MAELREKAEEMGSGAEVELPERMVARSQNELDAHLARAYEARRLAAPAWRLGVLDGDTPPRNYWTHAFVHEGWTALGLLLAVLLIAGAPLERSWGSLLYGLFVLLAIPISAQGYRLLDASSGVPWSGSSGLAAALVGAYFIRGLGGQFIVPSFVVLPVWLGLEAFVVRGFWLDDLGSVPWATLCGAIAIGATQAAALRLFGIEAKLDSVVAKRAKTGPNPVVIRAARLRSDGDPHQAFDLMQAAWREHRGDEEIAEVFFSIAVELGQPEAAAEAILPVLRSALKKGQIDRALSHWLPLATRRCEVRLEPTAAVRLGEALLDAGHPDEALFSLRSALDAGASTAHAVRILNIARDLDPGLTRRAASIALADPSLDAPTRARLEPLAELAEGDEPAASTAASSRAVAARAARPQSIAESPLERRVEAEHHAVEQTQFPSDPHESQLADQSLFGSALSEENLADELAAEPAGEALAGAEPSDVLSHWNDRGALDAGALADAGPSRSSAAADREADVLETRGLLFGDDDLDFLDADDDLSDGDQTPLLEDSTDELTSPMGRGAAATAMGDADGEATVMMSAATLAGAVLPSARAPRPATPSSTAPTTPTAPVAEKAPAEKGSAAPRSGAFLRALRTIEAVPVEVGADAIEIDTDGRGKSRLPFPRIEAIAVGVVRGLGPRPVVVVDCILNWRDDIGSPLKLIRFRSDRFEPGVVGETAPGTSPVAALGAFAGQLQRASGAACLPSEAILAGSYASFACLEDYEREVLGAERELGG
ncbi:MAG: rhomboid family intramembrane serine protease [Deltaproteobacteria bacterium]|nr:rhomboid family intramembrane serine protease [Deltaproteobacteria bacterium]